VNSFRHRVIAFRLSISQELDKSAALEARPMTYSIGGKQYVELAAGGHAKLGTKLGDCVLALTLP